MLGLMIRSHLIREATEICDDSLPSTWEFEAMVGFHPNAKNLFPFVYYRGDNRTYVNLTKNFGSRDKEKESTFGVIAKFDS
jgi:hypothetical protein